MIGILATMFLIWSNLEKLIFSITTVPNGIELVWICQNLSRPVETRQNLSKFVWNFTSNVNMAHWPLSQDLFNLKRSWKPDLQHRENPKWNRIGLNLSRPVETCRNLSKFVWNLTSNVRTWHWPLSHDLFNLKRSRNTDLQHREPERRCRSNWAWFSLSPSLHLGAWHNWCQIHSELNKWRQNWHTFRHL